MQQVFGAGGKLIVRVTDDKRLLGARKLIRKCNGAERFLGQDQFSPTVADDRYSTAGSVTPRASQFPPSADYEH